MMRKAVILSLAAVFVLGFFGAGYAQEGKKPKTHQAVEMEELTTTNADLTKELDHVKQKYEVARTFLDLQRRLERGEKLPYEEGHSGKKTETRSKRKREKR